MCLCRALLCIVDRRADRRALLCVVDCTERPASHYTQNVQHTACIISLGLDHCIAGDCNVHCESHLWLHPEAARP